MRARRWLAVAAVFAAALSMAAVAVAEQDFGLKIQGQLQAQSKDLFGVGTPLSASSSAQVTQEQALADPTSLLTLAKGLHAKVVTVGSAPNVLDQIALWPDDRNPQWLIECNEGGTTDPGLVRIDITTGESTTIVTGTTSCDPVRRTPWGTIVFAEEAGGGAAGGSLYEVSDPINTTGVTLDRIAHTFSGGTGAENLAFRRALGHLSFEGLAMYSDGLVYYGDENRPSVGTAGGAYFKFIPANPLAKGTGHIRSLDDSPLTDGSIYGLRVGLRSGATDYGQGAQFGFGSWVNVCTTGGCDEEDLRAQAAILHLTGYYRPEDADIDPVAEAAGNVRFCSNNTGNEEDDQLWGEDVCLTDGSLSDAETNAAIPEMQQFVQGNPSLSMVDNVDFQPGRNNVILHEDADTGYLTPHNNDLWDCLPDGADNDLLSDGCVRIATLNDLTAEWTGGAFSADGKHFYVSVQHNISGFGVVFDITGWR
jgi:secreted PhoX family phosphatase